MKRRGFARGDVLKCRTGANQWVKCPACALMAELKRITAECVHAATTACLSLPACTFAARVDGAVQGLGRGAANVQRKGCLND